MKDGRRTIITNSVFYLSRDLWACKLGTCCTHRKAFFYSNRSVIFREFNTFCSRQEMMRQEGSTRQPVDAGKIINITYYICLKAQLDSTTRVKEQGWPPLACLPRKTKGDLRSVSCTHPYLGSSG